MYLPSRLIKKKTKTFFLNQYHKFKVENIMKDEIFNVSLNWIRLLSMFWTLPIARETLMRSCLNFLFFYSNNRYELWCLPTKTVETVLGNRIISNSITLIVIHLRFQWINLNASTYLLNKLCPTSRVTTLRLRVKQNPVLSELYARHNNYHFDKGELCLKSPAALFDVPY